MDLLFELVKAHPVCLPLIDCCSSVRFQIIVLAKTPAKVSCKYCHFEGLRPTPLMWQLNSPAPWEQSPSPFPHLPFLQPCLSHSSIFLYPLMWAPWNPMPSSFASHWKMLTQVLSFYLIISFSYQNKITDLWLQHWEMWMPLWMGWPMSVLIPEPPFPVESQWIPRIPSGLLGFLENFQKCPSGPQWVPLAYHPIPTPFPPHSQCIPSELFVHHTCC